MLVPIINESNHRFAEALSTYSESFLDPLPVFLGFANRVDYDLREDKKYYQPLYPSFEDFNYLHDVSKLKHIYLNDFDFNVEEDRERFLKLTRLEFNSNTFETVAKCQCEVNPLRGNYLVNSGRVCPKCKHEVKEFFSEGEDTNVWIKVPEGVDTFLNIGFYGTFFSNLKIGSNPKIELVRYFVDSRYRRQVSKTTTASVNIVLNMASELGIERFDINSFYRNVDEIVHWCLQGRGRTHFKTVAESNMFWDIWLRYKHLAFCDYIKVPKRYSVVLERKDKEVYSHLHQPKTAEIYMALATTARSDVFTKLGETELNRNADIVGRNLHSLSEQYRKENNPLTLMRKKALFRKHASSGAVPYTGRTVVTSQTGIIHSDTIIIPWKMAIASLKPILMSYLYRKGYTPVTAAQCIRRSATRVDPVIDEFFKRHEDNRDILIQGGRNPTIEFLSLRTFYVRVNRNLEDESIKVPILACPQMNMDFDGKLVAVIKPF